MLLEIIRKDMMQAKIARDTVRSNLLSTLYAEIFTQTKSGKEMTEEDEIKIIKKFQKNIDETLALEIPEEARKKLLAEKTILESFLPAQLSEIETEKIVSKLVKENKQMKEIMAYFKDNYAGRYDGKKVNETVKKLIG
jgi:uncharacterized protein YqeY